MHELTLGWDFTDHHPVMLLDRDFDFPNDSTVLLADIPFTDFIPAIWATLVVGLFLYALWRLGEPPRSRSARAR